MMWRIALATTDGKVINEHFGRANHFYIIDIYEDQSYELIGKRQVVPLCQGGEHNEEGLKESIKALLDCHVVLVARIGMGAKKALQINHIDVFEEVGFIEECINKLARYLVKTSQGASQGNK